MSRKIALRKRANLPRRFFALCPDQGYAFRKIGVAAKRLQNYGASNEDAPQLSSLEKDLATYPPEIPMGNHEARVLSRALEW